MADIGADLAKGDGLYNQQIIASRYDDGCRFREF
jgi:hypothetical protein